MRAKNLEAFLKYAIYAGLGVIIAIPLITVSDLFFPFISGKVFVSRLVIQIMFACYIGLLLINPERYKPRWTWVSVATFALVAVLFITGLTGIDFYNSFWSSIERGEGLVLWLHLLALFVVATGLLKEHKQWLVVFDATLLVALVVAWFGITDYFDWGNSLLSNAQQIVQEKGMRVYQFWYDFWGMNYRTNGERISSTFGNPAFLAGYLLFAITLALHNAYYRRNRWLQAGYAALMVIFGFVLFQTGTRGGQLGILAQIILTITLLAFGPQSSRKIRLAASGVGVAVVLLVAGLFLARDSAFVQNSMPLQRLTSISLQDYTAQTRMGTWGAAMKGLLESPKTVLFGYGLENFNYVFNKYFPNVVYRHEGSQVWFDRAHSMIFDRAIAGGLLGLVAFLAFLVLPAWYLFKIGRRQPQQWPLVVIFVPFIVGYIIQDLLVFETIGLYFIVILTWAFFNLYAPEKHFRLANNHLKIAAGVYAIVFLVAAYTTVLKPWQANALFTEGLQQISGAQRDIAGGFEKLYAAIDMGTYGNQEYRLRLFDTFGQLLSAGYEPAWLASQLSKLEQLQQDQLAERPLDVKNHLFILHHYAGIIGLDPQAVEKAEALEDELIALSPDRPHVYYELGYLQFYVSRFLMQQGADKAQVQGALDRAYGYFNKAIELNPRVVESHINIIMLAAQVGEGQEIIEYLRNLDQQGINYRQPRYLIRMGNIAFTSQLYGLAELFYIEANNIEPTTEALIRLALTYQVSGKTQQAIEVAELVRELEPGRGAEVDAFIEQIKNTSTTPSVVQ